MTIPRLPVDVGDGLRLRRSTRADAAPLVEFNRMIHRDPGVVEPDEGIGIWTRDLLERPHPTFGEGDFTIVEEVTTGRIVSSCNLISQTWTYAGIPFKVGRPELVGTEPEYRRRGLVRQQFEVLHAWSAERGELVQAITGIPNYYRQFDYEMTVDLGGGRVGYAPGVPKLKEGQPEPYRLRPATDDDAAFLVACDARSRRESLLNCPHDAALWQFELSGKSVGNVNRLAMYIIEACPDPNAGDTLPNRRIGAVGTFDRLWGTRLGVPYVELLDGVSWLAVTPSILRGVWELGQQMASESGRGLESVQYGLGAEHPFYRVNFDRLPHLRRPYAWYLRVPDLPAFVRTIAPALEDRLSHSLAAGHTGELRMSFYRSGLRLRFEAGQIREVEGWAPDDSAQINFPGLAFLHVLFGHRSVDDLRTLHADCTFNQDEAKVLVDVLFPKQHSRFWAIA
jgi:hypothetical protein